MMFRLIVIFGLWLGFVPGYHQPESFITLKNDLDVARLNEPVVITRLAFEIRFGSGGSGNLPVLKSGDQLIPLQLDDINRDGKWDEMAFVVNIEARSSMRIEVIWLPKEMAPVFEKKTQVFLAEQNEHGGYTEVKEADAPPGLDGFPSRYQSEGVGWENDKIAFRVYFDCRNSKDLFGKLIPGLILQHAGTSEWGSYHDLAPWGMDILHCGSSLGAGGLAIVERDSLCRLGSTPVYQYAKITEGPVRTIFELKYQGWQVEGHLYDAIERITLWIGKYWFQSEVTLTGFTGDKQLATGIVTSKLDNEPIQFKANADYTALLTHGKQSLNNDTLAMAVLATSNTIAKIGRTSNVDFYQLGYQTVPAKSFSQVISETCYLGQKITSGIPSVHYFFALWGLENPAWNKVQDVKEYICKEADKFSRPITIKL
jgi:hypothetical protein